MSLKESLENKTKKYIIKYIDTTKSTAQLQVIKKKIFLYAYKNIVSRKATNIITKNTDFLILKFFDIK